MHYALSYLVYVEASNVFSVHGSFALSMHIVYEEYIVFCTQATERFEAIYPALKEVALAVSPGSKAMKQLTQQIMPFCIKAAGEGKQKLNLIASWISLFC